MFHLRENLARTLTHLADGDATYRRNVLWRKGICLHPTLATAKHHIHYQVSDIIRKGGNVLFSKTERTSFEWGA